MKHPKHCAAHIPLPPEWVALLTEADRDIRRLEPENPYRLYEFLHTTTRRFAPVDAFYVCLYSEAYQAMFFAYNAEGDIYDPPLTLPLGDGPTSRVIKQGRALSWGNAAEAGNVSFIMFGEVDNHTRSAMHVPIHAHAGKPGQDRPIVGVLSAQAYSENAYSAYCVEALQRLADCAGMALTRERDEAAWRYRLKVADTQAATRQRPLLAMAHEFVALLQDLSRHAEDARLLLPTDADPALSVALDFLCRECCAAQTMANQLPLRHDLAPHLAQSSDLDQLTPSERTILQQIADGQSNKAIAHALSIGQDTVKFHCKNIFHKLNVSSRTAAARIWLDSAPNNHT